MGRQESPLDPGAGPVQRFAFELRKLRQEAGGITYRAMARGTDYSLTTLSRAAAGEQLPSLPVTLAYVTACGGDGEEWERRWRAADEETTAVAVAADDSAPPYQGLARFEPGDRERFFGRERLAGEVLALVRGRRFSAVFGPSGSGKSSLLRAGLIPALQTEPSPHLRPAAIRILTPGPHPARTHTALFAPKDGPGETVVVIDQFEEVFTLCTDPAERKAFIDLALTALQPDSQLRVVLAVRADFYGRCAEHDALAQALGTTSLLVGPMNPAELREAIVKPAMAGGLIVEQALTARIVEEVTGEPGGLPLMSHALLETWRRRKGRALGEAAYEAAGGIHGAIARTAEDIYTQLTPTQADTARGILLRLITPGDGTPDTRRPTTRTELGSSQHDRDGDTATVLERLAHARLITLDGGTVDLAHEALIASWPRLRGWIDTDRGRLRIHRQLTEASLVWNDLDRDPGALYRGTRLAAAEEAFPTAYRKSGLSTLEMKFLMASLAARDREQRAVARTTRRLRAFTAALCVLALLASGTAALAFQQRATARTERDTAVSRQMTAEADRLRGTDAALQTQNASLAAQLDIAAYRKHPSPQTHISLISASTATLFSEISDQIGLVHEVTDTANNSAVTYSPDRKMLAIAGIDGTVRLWDIHDFTRPKRVGRSLTGPSGTVVAFSPRGHVLAVAGNWTIKLWNTSRPAHLTPLGVLQLPGNSAAASVAFSSDGRTLASGGERVTLWDVRDIAHPQQMDGSLPGGSVAFSPHGHVLATAYDGGGNVRLWDLSRLTHPAALSVLHTQTAVNFSVLAFSPDGRYLATDGTGIGQIRLWDTKNPVRPKVLDVPISNSDRTDVSAVAFSSNGHIVAVAGDNGTQLWNVTDPGDPLLLGKSLGHPSAAGISLVFGPDGRSLITIGTALRIWNLPPTVLTDCPNDSPVAFSPDGRTMATVCDTNERIWLWDTTDPTNPRHLGRALPGHIAAFAPHGHFLAIAADDGSVAFWDTADPTRPRHFGRRLTTPGDYGLDALAFSPDGHTLATTEVGEGNRIWLWDTTDPARARRLGQNLAPPVNYFLVGPVAFSPDGHTLAIPGHGDGNHNRIWLWDTTDPAHPQRLGRTIQGGIPAFAPLGHTLAVGTDIGDRAIQLWDTTHPAHLVPLSTPLTGTDPGTTPAFSPDGRTLAIGGDDGSVRLWNTKDPVHPVALGDPVTGHTSGIATMTFRPRDHILATVSIDGTIRLWDLDAERVIRRICTVTGHVLTRQRWQQYVGTIPYQSPCP